MKNRNWFSYTLDFTGIVALGGAAIAIAGALWFSASTVEAALLASFKYCLMMSVAAFLLARVCEIGRVMLNSTATTAAALEANTASASNVESLPQRRGLPKAA
jgi:hypothetical protein